LLSHIRLTCVYVGVGYVGVWSVWGVCAYVCAYALTGYCGDEHDELLW